MFREIEVLLHIRPQLGQVLLANKAAMRYAEKEVIL